MVIDFNYLYLLYDLKISGVIHIGAHYGEEIPGYLSKGINKVVCFEPVSSNFDVLKNHESDKVKLFKIALGNKEQDEVMMYLSSNNCESSSVLEPVEHLIDYSDISFDKYEFVKMSKLDSFSEEILGCNYLSLDVQGFEYEVLEGSLTTLNNIDYVYLEVNRGQTYANNKMVEDIDQLLEPLQFERVKTEWVARTWGDAFYIKRK